MEQVMEFMKAKKAHQEELMAEIKNQIGSLVSKMKATQHEIKAHHEI
jgi:hypothetical protein